jgi:hypothetical protein
VATVIGNKVYTFMNYLWWKRKDIYLKNFYRISAENIYREECLSVLSALGISGFLDFVHRPVF